MTYQFASSDVCRCGDTRLQHPAGASCVRPSCTCRRFRLRAPTTALVKAGPVCPNCRHPAHTYLGCTADNPNSDDGICYCAKGDFVRKGPAQ